MDWSVWLFWPHFCCCLVSDSVSGLHPLGMYLCLQLGSHRDVLKERLRCSLVGADTSFSLTFVFVTVWTENKSKGTSLQCKAAWLNLVILPVLVVEAFPKKGMRLMPVGVVVLMEFKDILQPFLLPLCAVHIPNFGCSLMIFLICSFSSGSDLLSFFSHQKMKCISSLVHKKSPCPASACPQQGQLTEPSQGWKFRLCCHALSVG